MTEIVSVYYQDAGGAERHDDYPAALSWRIDDGNLRVVGGGDKGIAAYPQGHWTKVAKRAADEESA